MLGVDLFVRDDEFFQQICAMSSLDACLAQSDIVVLTLPLTNQTKHLMNEHRFAVMKKGSVLVNISRGAVVDEKALLRALDEKLYGAVLDVFEEEPLSNESLLWEKENVLITPHNSFVGDGNEERLYTVIKTNLGKGKDK